MELKLIKEKTINGISVRTDNASEFSENGKLPLLWKNFDESVQVNYKNNERVYGVYTDYESDHNGKYTVWAGFDGVAIPEHLAPITIPSGQYLVFSHKGEMPQIAIDAWTEVWQYFMNKDANYQRVFSTDFEYYPNANEIELHIAIK